MLLKAPAPRPVRLGFAIRPAGLDGVEPIFGLTRSADGIWMVEGRPILALAQGGDEILTAVRNEVDPWSHFSGRLVGETPKPPQGISLSCPSGLARATEIYRTTLSPGDPFERFAVIAPPVDFSTTLVRTSGRSLWRGAIADRRGLMAAGAELTISKHQWLLDAARQRVLVDNAGPGLAGCLGVVALARLGFVRRAGQRLGRWMSQIRRDGHVLGARGEDEVLLAWAAAEYTHWTGERGWVREHRTPWQRLLNRISSTQPVPGGHELFGRDGSLRWTSLWRTAALLDGVVALRNVSDKTAGWALEGGRAREDLSELLGEPPWAAQTDRAADGSAAGMLAAAWLGLLPSDHPGVLSTVEHVMKHHRHGNGVFLQGGAHPAATALLMAIRFRLDPTVDRLEPVAALAAPTGAFPSARHAARGALGEGDDALGAALFLLLVLDAIQIRKGTLFVVPNQITMRDLPTPLGELISLQMGKSLGDGGEAPHASKC